MQDFARERPFDNFRVAITDPSHFFGHSELINTILRSPFLVRILLGGRRLGKTSALRAMEWNLLNPSSNYPRRAFPVLINLQLEQPKDLDNLRYVLIARLREAIERWREVPLTEMRQMYREFLSQIKGGEVTFSFLKQLGIKFNIDNPDHERRLNNDSFRLAFLKTTEELRKLNFQGVCFLIDGAEFIVRQNWATDAWAYLRGLKDTDTAIKPLLGLLLSGYRDLKEYQQRVGSPLLNIAEIQWLAQNTALEVAIFRYLTFVFFVPSRLKNIFEPRRRKEHVRAASRREEKYHFYASPRRGLAVPTLRLFQKSNSNPIPHLALINS